MKNLLYSLWFNFVNLAKGSKLIGKQLTNAISVTTNQFKQSNTIGSLDLTTNPNPSVMYCKWNPTATSTLTLVPGEGVILKDLGASDSVGLPIVDKRAADANAIEGVAIFDNKLAKKSPGDIISVAKFGAVVFMEASAAILRGASVALVLATPGQVVTTTTETAFGKALDKASAAGDLIRIEILSQGV